MKELLKQLIQHPLVMSIKRSKNYDRFKVVTTDLKEHKFQGKIELENFLNKL